jgi:hypothetical protein
MVHAACQNFRLERPQYVRTAGASIHILFASPALAPDPPRRRRWVQVVTARAARLTSPVPGARVSVAPRAVYSLEVEWHRGLLVFVVNDNLRTTARQRSEATPPHRVPAVRSKRLRSASLEGRERSLRARPRARPSRRHLSGVCRQVSALSQAAGPTQPEWRPPIPRPACTAPLRECRGEAEAQDGAGCWWPC